MSRTPQRPRTDEEPRVGVQASPGRLLTAEDLASRWQVPVSQVYRLTRAGAVPVVKLGRYYRYAVAAVEQFERDGGAADG